MSENDNNRDRTRVPDDAGGHAEQLLNILNRLPAQGRSIDVSAGWYSIIIALDQALAEIDPAYELHQVKQKLAGLCYYFHNDGDDADRMRELVQEAEAKAAVTCELCGEPGALHVSQHCGYRTLCSDCAVAEDKLYRPANKETPELTEKGTES